MKKILIIFAISLYPLISESSGNLAKYPPEEIDITITTLNDGYPKIAPEQIKLITGKYYRLNINCPDVRDDLTGWRIEMLEFPS